MCASVLICVGSVAMTGGNECASIFILQADEHAPHHTHTLTYPLENDGTTELLVWQVAHRTWTVNNQLKIPEPVKQILNMSA